MQQVRVRGPDYSGPSRSRHWLFRHLGRRPAEPGARSASFLGAVLRTLSASSLTRACSGQRTACFNCSVVPFWRRTLQPRRWWSALFVAAEARSVRRRSERCSNSRKLSSAVWSQSLLQLRRTRKSRTRSLLSPGTGLPRRSWSLSSSFSLAFGGGPASSCSRCPSCSSSVLST